jgi:hypothetical protein
VALYTLGCHCRFPSQSAISTRIRRIQVQRIQWDHQETEEGREFSPASFTDKGPEIRPEIRAWLKNWQQIIDFKDSMAVDRVFG